MLKCHSGSKLIKSATIPAVVDDEILCVVCLYKAAVDFEISAYRASTTFVNNDSYFHNQILLIRHKPPRVMDGFRKLKDQGFSI